MNCFLLAQSSPLTLKNLSWLQVASIYKDPSIGNLINIVIVNLVVIHNEQVINFVFFLLSVPEWLISLVLVWRTNHNSFPCLGGAFHIFQRPDHVEKLLSVAAFEELSRGNPPRYCCSRNEVCECLTLRVSVASHVGGMKLYTRAVRKVSSHGLRKIEALWLEFLRKPLHF